MISLARNKKDPEYGRADLNQLQILEPGESGKASRQFLDAY